MPRRNGAYTNTYTQAEIDARLAEVDEEITKRISAKMPRNAKSMGLAPEGHLHGPLGQATLPAYDYVISSSYSGPAGAVFKAVTGKETRLYATIGGAMTHAASLASGSDRSFWIVGGTYSEQVSVGPPSSTTWEVWGEGQDKVEWAATANSQNLWKDTSPATGAKVVVHDIHFNLSSFTGCIGLETPSASVSDEVLGYGRVFDCKFTTGGDTTSKGLVTGEFDGVGESLVVDCEFEGSGIGIRAYADTTIRGGQIACGIGVQPSQATNQRMLIEGVFLAGSTAGVSLGASDQTTVGFVQVTNCTVSGPFIIVTSGAGAISGLSVSDNRIILAAQTGINFGNLTSDSVGVVITGNTFNSTSASAVGIALDSNLTNGICSNNTFSASIPLANCITGTAGANFQVFHNKSDAGALADSGSPVGHLPAAGTAAIVVEEDNATVSAGASIIDFTEPDGTLTSVTGSAPNQEVDVNMALYAKLAGRSGGQTLIGGTAAGNDLDLLANSTETTFVSVVPQSVGQITAITATTTVTANLATVTLIADPITVGGNNLSISGWDTQGGILNTTRTGTNLTGMNSSMTVEGGTVATYQQYVATLGTTGSTIITAATGIKVARGAGYDIAATSGTAIGLLIEDVGHANFSSVTGLRINSQTNGVQIKLMEPSAGANFTTITAGAQTADINYTLPTAAPSVNGQVLSSTTAGVMSWAAGGSGDDALSIIGHVMGVG